MKKLVLIFVFCIVFINAKSQVYESNTFRYTGPDSIINAVSTVDNSGNVYLAGTIYGTNKNYDYIIVKYNNCWGKEWVITYDGGYNRNDILSKVTIDNNGNIYATGFSHSSRNIYEIATIKYDNNGQQQWINRKVSNNSMSAGGSDIIIDKNYNVIITGIINGNQDIVIKYDSTGTQMWEAIDNDVMGIVLALDKNDNIFVGCGYIKNPKETIFNSTDNFVVKKYDSNGNKLWANTYNGQDDNSDHIISLKTDTTGNVYLAGNINCLTHPNICIIKYNADGSAGWVSLYDNSAEESTFVNGMVIDYNQKVNIIGTTTLTGGYSEYITIKFDSLGNVKWENRYSSAINQNDYGIAIACDSSNNLIVTGYTEIIDTTYVPSSLNILAPPTMRIFTKIDVTTLKYFNDSIGSFLWRYTANKRDNNQGGRMIGIFDKIDENISKQFVNVSNIQITTNNNIFISGLVEGVNNSYDFYTINLKDILNLNNDYEAVGYLHNYILDDIANNIKTSGIIFRNINDVENYLDTVFVTLYLDSSKLDSIEYYNNEMIMFLDSAKYIKDNIDSILLANNFNTVIYYDSIIDICFNNFISFSDIDNFITEITNVEIVVNNDSNCNDSVKAIVLSKTSVAKYSAVYWYNEYFANYNSKWLKIKILQEMQMKSNVVPQTRNRNVATTDVVRADANGAAWGAVLVYVVNPKALGSVIAATSAGPWGFLAAVATWSTIGAVTMGTVSSTRAYFGDPFNIVNIMKTYTLSLYYKNRIQPFLIDLLIRFVFVFVYSYLTTIKYFYYYNTNNLRYFKSILIGAVLLYFFNLQLIKIKNITKKHFALLLKKIIYALLITIVLINLIDYITLKMI